MQQGSYDVVTGLCAFAGREFRGPGEYLHSSVRDALARTAGHASVRDLGQLVEPTPVFQRNAEQFGDQLGRQRPGDVVDGVALTLLDNAVDHVARHVRDVLIEEHAVAGPLVQRLSEDALRCRESWTYADADAGDRTGMRR